ncbi:Rne/Rng family ribonuclease [Bacillus salipaludis]|uniref:Rne/Rng family ribonuclease n=1 Tax=Bacillus salipaludis TaxID=2547811 RepID=A0A4R5VSY3_9BACI|nr:Rne/Rng family ribonuclease [Bacillus salipaludis]TDK61570.1 Rne/Rng family ribonuclease [Bacillus salipaludis]
MDQLIINYQSREKRFAFMRNHKVEKMVFDRPEQRSLVGNIYYGTVSKVLPGMNAVFVDIGEEKHAYLHRDLLPSYVLSLDKINEKKGISTFVHQGEKLLVQVNKDATGTKGMRVTGIIEIQGNQLIYMPQGRYVAVSKKIADDNEKASLRRIGHQLKTADEGIIFRTSSLFATEEEIHQELEQLRVQHHELMKQAETFKKPGLIFQKDTFVEMLIEVMANMDNGEVLVDDLSLKRILEEHNQNATVSYYGGKENIFAVNRVEHEIDKALKRVVWLENGSYLIFDETEALTIIDVNTGKFSGKSDYQETVLKTNLLAAKEICRQLRLRDIGGIVLIDFIDMHREQDKQSVLAVFEQNKDENRIKLIGYTPLGILQLTRKKTKVSLSEALTVKCSVCEGTGRILSQETVAFRLERELVEHRNGDFEAVLVETTKEVKEAMAHHLEFLEESLKFKVYFSVKPNPSHYYLLKQFGEESEMAQKAGDFY